ncbi:MAG: alanine--tRNA ligase [Desulfovermiculus sp.]
MISAAEIRRSFLNFFAQHEHQIVPSSPLIPKDDPSLLFTNAGMVQFKKLFLGQEMRPYKRAVTSQKCLRVGGKHNDLENVGRTARHHTFFEMLGNFSFGDYFKEQAIALAWEYLTKELGLPADRMYATVYQDDDEAIALWQKVAGLPKERIYRLGEKDNFWAMGDTGPCGPCSEVHYDQGEHMACGPDCEIGVCECDRFLEIWNLVFMQYDRDESGNMTPLPKPSIDTGMGLERVAAVCQGVYSNFDTDLFTGLIHSMAYKAGVQYTADPDTDVALRVIADHCRAVPFMIADGILPANEGRGYVLRRLIRRAFRFGRFLGLVNPFLHEICGQTVREMGEAYPELQKTGEFMDKVVFQEEENFSRTLDKGLSLLEDELQQLADSGRDLVPGEVVFKLYDTFGFPVDIVKDVAEKQGFQVDEPGFDQLMNEQRQRSKAAWSGSGEIDLASSFSAYLEAGWKTEFVGYDSLQSSSRIVGLMSLDGQDIAQVEAGQEAYVITARSPFYGESGGQVGDVGQLLAETGQALVKNTLKPARDFIVHLVQVEKGSLGQDQEVNLHVEEGPRIATARNHTCTHLLHAALRDVLGQHVAQSGSLVGPRRLRFDFTHINPLTENDLLEVENRVNAAILADIHLHKEVMPFEQARQEGAVGLFTEKYADEVRVVSVPGVSKELCGGTHLESTGQAGSFTIISEAGIASGVRRIEAATGWNALELYRQQRQNLEQVAASLRVHSEDVVDKILELQNHVKALQKEKEALQASQFSGNTQDVMSQKETINGIPTLALQLDLPPGAGMKSLRSMMDDLRTKMQSGIIFLATPNGDKANLLLSVSADLHDRFTAPDLIQDVAKEVEGKGGGRPDLAQAGGNDPSGIERAVARLKEILAK